MGGRQSFEQRQQAETNESTEVFRQLRQDIQMPWKKGQSGNPKGRPKGSRDKLTKHFIDDLSKHYEKHGMKAIERVFEEKPEMYIKTIAGLLPKDVNFGIDEETREHLSKAELATKLFGLLESGIISADRGTGSGALGDMDADTGSTDGGIPH